MFPSYKWTKGDGKLREADRQRALAEKTAREKEADEWIKQVRARRFVNANSRVAVATPTDQPPVIPRVGFGVRETRAAMCVECNNHAPKMCWRHKRED